MNVPIVLQEGFETEWQVWRPFNRNVTWFEMAFPRMQKTELEDAILGKYQNSKGEPVHMALTLNGKTCVFEQNHGVFSRSDEHLLRQLSPAPLNSHCADFQEIVGQNHWRFKVILVGDKLRGTHTQLQSPSPYGSFKSMPNNVYGKFSQFNVFLGWFIAPFWIFWVLGLIFYDLFIFIRRLKTKQA